MTNTDTAKPVRVEVRKDGSKFVGDLIWSDGKRWNGWQVFRTMKALTENARATFQGPIMRVEG